MGKTATLRPLMPGREPLVTENIALAEDVARRIHARLPLHVQLDDLISDGFIGLIDAANRFDPARGLKFKTFAQVRINGEIWDGLRRRDEVRRNQRANGDDRRTFQLPEVNRGEVDRMAGRSDLARQRMQQRQVIADYAKGMSRTDRLIIVLYYFEEMTMAEIAATLGLCESRVQQLMKIIRARLRAKLHGGPDACSVPEAR